MSDWNGSRQRRRHTCTGTDGEALPLVAHVQDRAGRGGWLYRQEQLWIDNDGHTHQIAEMSLHEIEEAIQVCQVGVAQIHALLYLEAIGQALALKLASNDCEAHAVAADANVEPPSDLQTWFETTPLVGALRRRLHELKCGVG